MKPYKKYWKEFKKQIKMERDKPRTVQRIFTETACHQKQKTESFHALNSRKKKENERSQKKMEMMKRQREESKRNGKRLQPFQRFQPVRVRDRWSRPVGVSPFIGRLRYGWMPLAEQHLTILAFYYALHI